MTEREFDQKIEDMAARFERRVEAAADCLDRRVTRKYEDSRLFRFCTAGGSLAAGIGLLAGAKHLADRGYRTAAMWSAGLGLLGIVVELLRILVFRRKK